MIAVFRRELNGYFKSMMGYLFSAFVLIFAGIYTMVYNLSGYTAHFERVLSSISFLYLIAVPILTMRSVAEEKKQKTDQLLYSLPISLSSVVVGKYLAMLVVLLVPTAIMGLYPLILSQFGTVLLQTAYGALEGFFLLGACLLSIGLFVSSVTENQVAAAVITLVVMLVLYFMSGLASYVSTAASASLTALIIVAAVLCLALAGCEYDDAEVKDRLDDLEGRVDALEKTVNSLNINVGNLQSLIDGKLFITAVTENPEGGGYTLSLVTSDGEASQIVIKDGEAGAAPAIGVKLDSDGKYYWTLDGEFITEGGKKMPVTGDDGVTPVFKIEDDTWYVSYDKEATWKECGPATGAAGDSFFSDVSTSEDGRWVYLTLADGETVLTLEMYKEFGIAFESLPELIMAGATAEIPFVLTGADEKSVVEAIAKGDWEAEAVMDGTEGGKIVVTAPAESSTGRVIVLLSDGESKTIMKTLTFVSGVMNVTTQSQEAAAVGGTVSFELETDLDYEVVIPDDAKEWLSRVETRALRQETLTFSAKANETMEERQAKIELISSGVVVETLLVYQKANLDPTAFVVIVDADETYGDGFKPFPQKE